MLVWRFKPLFLISARPVGFRRGRKMASAPGSSSAIDIASELLRASFNSLGPPKPPQPTNNSSNSNSKISDLNASEDRVSYHKRLRDYLLLLEYSKFKDQAPGGVFVLPSQDDLRRWHGVIFLRAGLYKNAVFKFIILIPDDYPEEPPKLYFCSRVFHPSVNPATGELDISPQFSPWQQHKHYLCLVVAYMKRIFYKTDNWIAEKAFNLEAYRLWRTDPSEFHRCCAECAEESVERAKENPMEDASIRFTDPQPAHEAVFAKICAMGDVTTEFSFGAWFSDGVDNLIHAPQLSLNLLAMGHEGTSNAHADALKSNAADYEDEIPTVPVPEADAFKLVQLPVDDESDDMEFQRPTQLQSILKLEEEELVEELP